MLLLFEASGKPLTTWNGLWFAGYFFLGTTLTNPEAATKRMSQEVQSSEVQKDKND